MLLKTPWWLVACCAAHLAWAATYYVDQHHPSAADDNPGTPEAPFKTIQKAAEVALPGDTVNIRAGRYRGAVVNVHAGRIRPGRWTEQDRITYQAAGGGEVILDGSIRLDAESFKPREGCKKVFAYKVEFPVVIDYAKRHMRIESPVTVFADEVLLLPNVVERKDAAKGTTRGLEIPDDTHDNRWYFDSKEKVLYVNLGGRTPQEAPVDVSAYYHAFGHMPLHYVTLRGLTLQRYSHRAIALGDSLGARIEDCVFRHNAIDVSGGRDSHVTRCTFLDTESSAIEGGVYTLLSENLIIRFWRDSFQRRNIYESPAIRSFANGESSKTIRNNVIVDEGAAGYTGCGGFWPDMPNPGNVLYGNTIARVGQAMYIEYASLGTLIAWNVFEDCQYGVALRHNAGNLITENYFRKIVRSAYELRSTAYTQYPLMRQNIFTGNYMDECGCGVVAGPQARASVQHVNLVDGNIYNLTQGNVAAWVGKPYKTIEAFRAAEGMEMHGSVGRIPPEELVSFRVADSRKPWAVNQMIGNPHLDRLHWNRGDWTVPYFFEPGMGDGAPREWLPGRLWSSKVGGACGPEPDPRGIFEAYLAAEPFRGCVMLWADPSPVKGRGYMQEEEGLTGRGATADIRTDGRLMVLARESRAADEQGLGWYSVSLPTVPGAVIDIGFWMQAVNVKPVAEGGGALSFVEFSDYHRHRLSRVFILGRDGAGREHLPQLVAGTFGYSRVAGTVTAPEWAKRFRLFMGMRSATGVLQFDDIDTIRTRPGQAPPEAQPAQGVPPPVMDPATLQFTIVDLSSVVNRPLADEKDDDGEGGWSDQGAAMDMRGIATGDKTYEGVPFKILSPKSCVVLKSGVRKSDSLPAGVKIPVGLRADMVYFLHSGAWLGADHTHWQYVIRYEDGGEETIPVIGRYNIRDWTEETGFLSDDKQQWRAFSAETTGGAVFVQQSLWVLEYRNPHPDKTIKSIEMISAGKGVPILLGITVGTKK